MEKLNKFLPLLTLVLLVVGFGYLASRPQVSSFGGTTNFNDLSVDSITNAGALTQTGAVDIAGALSASSTLNVQGNITTRASTTIGLSGTAVNKIICATNTTYKAPAMNGGASSTIPFSLSGFSTSTAQAYWFGFATSSGGWENIQLLSVQGSTTANGVDVYVRNNTTGTTFAAKTTAVTSALCALQVN